MLVGCQSYQTRVYDVSVKNYSSGPITIWLTKSGPPYEEGWMAPEDIAVESPKEADRIIGGVIVPAGKTADTGPIQGRFEAPTRAILRVYGGKLTFDQLLASSEHDKNRVDIGLHPGKSELVVTGTPDYISVKSGSDTP
jgi:hypothetical protein